MSLGYVNSIGRNLPVLIDINIIPTGAHAGRRPADLLDGGQRPDPRQPDLQPRQRVPVDRRGQLQRVHRDAQQAHEPRRGRCRRPTPGPRATDNAPLTGTYVVGSGDDRLSDPVEPGPRQGRHAVQPDAHLRGVSTLLAAAGRAATGSGPTLANNNQLGLILPGEQRPAVQHPLEPGPEPGRRHQRPAARHRPQHRPLRAGRSTSTCATRASSRSARASRPSCSSRPRTSSTPAARTRRVRHLHHQHLGGEPGGDHERRRASPRPRIPDPFAGTAGYQQRQVQLGVKLSF